MAGEILSFYFVFLMFLEQLLYFKTVGRKRQQAVTQAKEALVRTEPLQFDCIPRADLQCVLAEDSGKKLARNLEK